MNINTNLSNFKKKHKIIDTITNEDSVEIFKE